MFVSLGPLSPEVLVFCAVFALLASVILSKPARRRRLSRFASARIWTGHGGARPAPDATDPAEQLRVVMAASFTRKLFEAIRLLLSRTEAKVMRATEAAIAEAGLGWRVLAQVSLGEVVASPDKAAFRAINAKRVDLLIVSERNLPLAAIEYQGEGHWQGSAPARDAVKKEALRRAGIGYIEVTPAHGPEDIRREVARLARGACRDGAGASAPRRLAG